MNSSNEYMRGKIIFSHLIICSYLIMQTPVELFAAATLESHQRIAGKSEVEEEL
jgi:hypothetical protein